MKTSLKQTAGVYIADTDSLRDGDLFQDVYCAVSEERRAKTDRKRFSKDKRLSLGVEYLLMTACRDLGVIYRNQKVITDKFGKPRFDCSGIFFNLSHSDSRVMCAVSTFPIGCDTEKIIQDRLGVARRFFADSERELISSLKTEDERNKMFFRLWTLKESFMKCTGQGLHLPLSEFSVSFDGDLVTVSQTFTDRKYSFSEYDRSDGFCYSWCLETENPDAANTTPIITEISSNRLIDLIG